LYKEENIKLHIQELDLQLYQITNIDEVFDALITSEKNNPALIDERIPYWTELWPSAIALSEFIIENSLLLNDKKVIEIGAGLALPSLVASRFCDYITTTDYIQDALHFAQRNSELNKIENIKFDLLDWRNIRDDHPKYDVILASDIAYEKRFFADLPTALLSLMHEDSIAILTEPNRLFAKPFIDALHKNFAIESSQKSINHRGINVQVGIHLLRKI
jgi:predicted nicotinamide N-methyase